MIWGVRIGAHSMNLTVMIVRMKHLLYVNLQMWTNQSPSISLLKGLLHEDLELIEQGAYISKQHKGSACRLPHCRNPQYIYARAGYETFMQAHWFQFYSNRRQKLNPAGAWRLINYLSKFIGTWKHNGITGHS